MDKGGWCAYIKERPYLREDFMAKFVHIKDRLVNLDNVDYMNLDEGADHRLRIFFNGSGTLEFEGDEALELKNYFIEENVMENTPPTT